MFVLVFFLTLLVDNINYYQCQTLLNLKFSAVIFSIILLIVLRRVDHGRCSCAYLLHAVHPPPTWRHQRRRRCKQAGQLVRMESLPRALLRDLSSWLWIDPSSTLASP
ncbi:hypothetical protein ILYODFUR_017093 [Ilyodon furcidens]|uniref:Uncharacterized protein n=1 Tax=Ilyodon furcidens TaxID=33524 RepID=A0ABV0V4P7_9TELE